VEQGGISHPYYIEGEKEKGRKREKEAIAAAGSVNLFIRSTVSLY